MAADTTTDPRGPASDARGGGRRGRLRAHLADPLYRTGYLLTLSSGVSALLGFGFWTLAAHRYSAHQLGINSSTIAAMTFVSSLAQGGLGGVLLRYVPSAGRDTRRLILYVYAATVASSMVLATAAALTSPLWSSSLGMLGHDPAWCFGFIAATALWTIFTLQDVVLTGLRESQIVPVENICYAIVKLALVLGLGTISPKAGPFIAWNAPGAVGVAMISWIIFRRLLTRRERGLVRAPDVSSGDAGLPSSRTFGAAVAANLAGGLFVQAAVYLTPVIVTAMLGPTREAYFYAPWTILVALNAITVATMSSLTVEAARNRPMVFGLARRALLQTLAILAPVLLVLLVGAPLVLHLYGGAYAHAGTRLMRLLALSLIPSAVSSIGLGIARVLRRYWLVTAILALPSLLQLVLTVALIDGLGISAAGWAQLIADGVAAVTLGLTLMRPVFGRGQIRPRTAA